ncbi:MAG: TIGR02206 family membrane protein [Oscillospiraceae bacterium]|nr:TIGR02206 family membrane protein [Oscillospiraceae bacterium]
MDKLKDFFGVYLDGTIRCGIFSTPHLIWLFSMAIVWIFILIFFKNKKKHTQDIFLYFLVFIIILTEILRYYVFISNNILRSFVDLAPFHICGFMVFVTCFAVFFRNKILMNFCYAFSFTATIFGVLTPIAITFPPLSFVYVQGMLSHGIMFLIAMFFIVDCGFRPEVKYLPRISAIFFGVAFLVIAPLNYIFNANWFFIAWAPKGTPIEILENLVGWPGYIGVLFVILMILWTIMYLPFYIAEKFKEKQKGVFN